MEELLEDEPSVFEVLVFEEDSAEEEETIFLESEFSVSFDSNCDELTFENFGWFLFPKEDIEDLLSYDVSFEVPIFELLLLEDDEEDEDIVPEVFVFEDIKELPNASGEIEEGAGGEAKMFWAVINEFNEFCGALWGTILGLFAFW